jgi:GNAT superfamily N-acetyltransferase
VNEVIRQASGDGDYDAFSQLICEYVAWLRSRYEHDAWIVTEVLDKQALTRELAELPTIYGPPNGRAFVAVHGGEIRGCGAYRRLGEGSCEMKRVYVTARFRGTGLGRRLCDALIAAACEDGYRSMKLDTGSILTEAIGMYHSLGFRECAPYHEYPAKLMPYFVFMERALAPA